MTLATRALELLAERGPMSALEIQDATGSRSGNVANAMHKLMGAGKVVRSLERRDGSLQAIWSLAAEKGSPGWVDPSQWVRNAPIANSGAADRSETDDADADRPQTGGSPVVKASAPAATGRFLLLGADESTLIGALFMAGLSSDWIAERVHDGKGREIDAADARGYVEQALRQYITRQSA